MTTLSVLFVLWLLGIKLRASGIRDQWSIAELNPQPFPLFHSSLAHLSFDIPSMGVSELTPVNANLEVRLSNNAVVCTVLFSLFTNKTKLWSGKIIS